MKKGIVLLLIFTLTIRICAENNREKLVEQFRQKHFLQTKETATQGISEELSRETAQINSPELNNDKRESSKSDLQILVEKAWKQNQNLTSLKEMRTAQKLQADSAGALMDPMMTFGKFIEPVETRVGPQDFKIGISQKYPWSKKRSLQTGIARFNEQITDKQLMKKRLKIKSEIEKSYYDFYLTHQKLLISQEMFEIIGYMETVSLSKYKTGMADHSSIVKLQLEKGKLQDKILMLTNMQRPLSEKIHAITGNTTELLLPWPKLLEDPQIGTSLETFYHWMETQNPDLSIEQLKSSQNQKKADLQERMNYPDITVGIDYIHTNPARMPGVSDSGKDPIIAMIGINLPINQKKNKNREDSFRLMEKSNLSNKNQMVRELKAKLAFSHYTWEDQYRKFQLYKKELLPRGEESYEVTLQAYAADQVVLIELIDSMRTLLELKLTLEETRVQFFKSQSEIHEICNLIEWY